MLLTLIVLSALGGALVFGGALSLYSLFIAALAIGVVFSVAAFVVARRAQRHRRA